MYAGGVLQSRNLKHGPRRRGGPLAPAPQIAGRWQAARRRPATIRLSSVQARVPWLPEGGPGVEHPILPFSRFARQFSRTFFLSRKTIHWCWSKSSSSGPWSRAPASPQAHSLDRFGSRARPGRAEPGCSCRCTDGGNAFARADRFKPDRQLSLLLRLP